MLHVNPTSERGRFFEIPAHCYLLKLLLLMINRSQISQIQNNQGQDLHRCYSAI